MKAGYRGVIERHTATALFQSHGISQDRKYLPECLVKRLLVDIVNAKMNENQNTKKYSTM